MPFEFRAAHGSENGEVRPLTSSGKSAAGGEDELDLGVLREESSDSVKTDAEASEVLSKTLGVSWNSSTLIQVELMTFFVQMEEVKVVKTARSQSGVTPSRQAQQKLDNIELIFHW